MLNDRPLREIPGDRPRKWLFDDKIELIVWFDSPTIIYGFQILYDLHDSPKALTITGSGGFTHQHIDSGENGDLISKGTPVLSSIAASDLPRVIELLRERATDLPTDISNFIEPRLKAILQEA